MAGPLLCRVAHIFLLFLSQPTTMWAVQSTTAREESVLFTRGARLIFLHSLGKFLLYFFFFQIKHGQLLIDLCLPPFFFSHRRRRYRVPRAGNEVRVPAVGVEPER